MRTFVTGATGLVGRHVVARLLARGDEVVALARPGSDTTALVRAGCTLFRGGLEEDPAELVVGMRNCEALVHAAALVGQRTSRARYHALNVRGTAGVLSAAAAAGVRHAVHVSSVAVYGDLRGSITEDRWQEKAIPAAAFYARSKREAEEAAWRHDGTAGMRVVAVRPALIFGEHDRHVAHRLDRLVRRRVLPLPDGGRRTPPLVYAGNVAKGIVAALERPEVAGYAYNLAHDHDMPLAEIVRTWCRIRRIPVPRMPAVPGALLVGAAVAVDVLSRSVPGIDLPGVTRPARLMRIDNPYDSDRARRELGWTELVPLERALERTSAWLDGHRQKPIT